MQDLRNSDKEVNQALGIADGIYLRLSIPLAVEGGYSPYSRVPVDRDAKPHTRVLQIAAHTYRVPNVRKNIGK